MAGPFPYKRLTGKRRWMLFLAGALTALTALTGSPAAKAQQPSPGAENVVRLEAKQQRKEGQTFYADGDVEMQYGNLHIRADHVEYNGANYQTVARGHVQFDYHSQHLEADQADYNFHTGRGHFEHVHGELRLERAPNPSVMVTSNPLSFEAETVDRVDESTYHLTHARVTVCDPRKPKWTFNASEGTLHVDQKIALLNANFRLLRIPLFYAPYASMPAGRKLRRSGFLMPEVGRSSIKGDVIGDAYYWAPTDWMDTTLGAEYLSRRGSSQNVNFRARPAENVSLSATYFGVVDRLHEGGHALNVRFDALWGNGWHAAVDANQLSSYTFQLVFSPTFAEAINSEVQTNAFLTRNFSGFSINFATNNYQDFLTAQPQTAVTLRTAPEARFDSSDQAPWKRWPFYFGVDVYNDGVHRDDPNIQTPALVDRSEFAPRVTVPLHWGSWLGVTPTFSFRTMRYGSELSGNTVVNTPTWNTTGEISVDLRPPSLERVWERPHSKWKHTIEPRIVYTYVTGVNDFARFIRIDQDDTLTDTNEVEYSITQRLFRRKNDGASEEVASWTLLQKYYFDPTFGGAILPGGRNVVEALDAVTPFAFADGPRNFSPIVSDIKITPGGAYDAEFRLDYDPVRKRITTAESLLKLHPYGNFQLTLAHYSIDANTVLQPLANQLRALVGYGDLNRRGWNASFGFSYDLNQGVLQNELAQIGYNGSCCGIAFGYQRLSLAQIRSENQFRVSLVIANIGSFGTVRKQDKVF